MPTFLLLNKTQLHIYEALKNTVLKGKNETTIKYSGDTKTVLRMLKIVLGEFSECFYYDNCSLQYSPNGIWGTTIILTKWAKNYQLVKMREEFRRCSNIIIDSVISPEMNDMQKALALHNYLVNNVTYTDESFKTNYQKLHTAYGAIVDKTAVCEGISAAYCYLLKSVGIQASIVNGSTDNSTSVDHCWNIVKIASDYYHVDVTWDLKNKNNYNYNCFDYFGLMDSDLSDRRWDRTIYPKSNSCKMNFFYLTKSIAKTENEFVSIASRQSMKRHAFYLKFDKLKQFDNETTASDYIFKLIRSHYDLSRTMQGHLSCVVNLDQSTVFVKCS